MFGNVKIDIINNDEPKISGVINNLTPRGVVSVMEAVMRFLDLPDIEAYQKIKSIYEPYEKPHVEKPHVEKPRIENTMPEEPKSAPRPERVSEAIGLLERIKNRSDELPVLTSTDTKDWTGATFKVMKYILSKTGKDGCATINARAASDKLGISATAVFRASKQLEDCGATKRVTKFSRNNVVMPLKRLG